MAYVDKTFQERMIITCKEIFEQDHFSIDGRSRSLLEEALEVVQTVGYTREKAHQLVDYIFNRPIGDIWQEVGGLLSTLAAFADINEIDLMKAGEDELDRLNSNKETISNKHKLKQKI